MKLLLKNPYIFKEIDKQLAQEVYKHHEYLNYLNIQHKILDEKFPPRKTIQNEFNTTVNNYLNDKFNHCPLILYSFNEHNKNAYDVNYDCSTDELISSWVSSSVRHSNFANIINRFCSHTVLSADIITLVQSIFHQICYLLNIHESWSFNVI